MSGRSFPALGFDPTPGDVHEVQLVARRLADACHEVTSAHRGISTAGNGAWLGQAATAFHDQLQHDFAPKLNVVAQAFGQAAQAVGGWGSTLDELQRRAGALERVAAEAIREAERAAGWLAAHPAIAVQHVVSTVSTTAVDSARAAAEAADAAVNSALDEQARERAEARAWWAREQHVAEQQLAALRREAHHLHEELLSRGRAVAQLLHEAQDLAPHKPGMFQRMAHAVTSGIGDAWAWTKAHADTIKLIGDVLSSVSAVLGTLAILTAPFEPIGAVFGAAALGVGAAAMGTHLLAKAAGAEVSMATLGMDVVGVLPGIGGMAKATRTGVKVVTVAEAGRLGGGGLSLTSTVGRRFVLFGERQRSFRLVGDGTLGSSVRLGLGQVSQGLHQGQLIGTKSFNFAVTRLPALGRMHPVDPMSLGSRLVDAGIKIVPKGYTVPVTIHNDLHHDRPVRVTHPGEVFRVLLAS